MKDKRYRYDMLYRGRSPLEKPAQTQNHSLSPQFPYAGWTQKTTVIHVWMDLEGTGSKQMPRTTHVDDLHAALVPSQDEPLIAGEPFPRVFSNRSDYKLLLLSLLCSSMLRDDCTAGGLDWGVELL
jgi:hypothetical protein